MNYLGTFLIENRATFVIKRKTLSMKLIGITLILTGLLISCTPPLPQTYPPEVEAVLIKSQDNRKELEEALDHFYKKKDSTKIKAIEFLIANMDIHCSRTYYWKTSKGEKIAFSEFDYPDLKTAVGAIDSLRLIHGGLYQQDTIIYDMNVLTANYLTRHVNQTVDNWKTSVYKDIAFESFCEYLLPYRVTVEPVTDWWQEYHDRYKWLGDSLRHKPLGHVMDYAAIDYKEWFTFTTGKETRDELISRLSAKQLLFRKKGPCEDVASLETFILRSQSIPVAYITIPFWATSTGAHFMNAVFHPDMSMRRLDVSKGSGRESDLDREPAKVIRHTYSKQAETLAMYKEIENIPPGFLRTSNYIDVTADYWEIADVTIPLFPSIYESDPNGIVYAGMFNHGCWHAGWWGKVQKDSVTFKNMAKGVVILPMVYKDESFIPAGYPVLNAYNHQIHLAPDLNHRRQISIVEQDRYLKFRLGKEYELFYWNKDWTSLGKQTAQIESRELVFKNVPMNALLRLVPEYSEQKERPFIILPDGTRYWW